jgi:addiction module RelE/StbE family toxin
MKVRWLKEATASLDGEYEFLVARNPSAAKKVFQRIVSSVSRLQDFPESGRMGHVPGTRELVMPGLPYIVIYRTTDTAIEILRVFHTSQDRSHLFN